MAVKVGGDKVRYSHANFPDFLRHVGNDIDQGFLNLSEEEIREETNLFDVRDIQGSELFFRVTGDFVSNGLFSGFWVLLAILLGKVWWWLGLAVAAIFTLVEVLDLIQAIFTTIVGLAAIPMGLLAGKTDEKDPYWLILSSLPRLAGSCLGIFYLYILYRNLFSQ